MTAASFQPNIRGGKVIAVSMKHMPHFISDYGNGLFPIMKQSVPTGCNKVFSAVN